ncbi:MAG: hypothetical protein DYG91_12355 [Chloroflexi bacterium CFX7]|nr:hypothetical protein [Chloroflexi bacterium CFX7]
MHRLRSRNQRQANLAARQPHGCFVHEPLRGVAADHRVDALAALARPNGCGKLSGRVGRRPRDDVHHLHRVHTGERPGHAGIRGRQPGAFGHQVER